MGDEHPMFEEAERTGKWFYLPQLQRWLSPEALRRKQAEGKWVGAPDDGEGWVLATPPADEIMREADEDLERGLKETVGPYSEEDDPGVSPGAPEPHGDGSDLPVHDATSGPPTENAGQPPDPTGNVGASPPVAPAKQ